MAEITVQQAMEIAIGHHQAGRTAEAEAIFRQMQDAVGDNAVALQGLGISAQQAGLGATALRLFLQAVMIQPDLAEAHNRIGVLLRDRGQAAEALKAFANAQARQPGNAEYLYNLASMLRAIGRTPEAIAALKHLTAGAPALAIAHYEMGRALETSGRLDDAIGSYRRAFELDPKLFPALHYLGIALGQKGQFPQAIATLQHAAQLAPGDAMIQMNLAHALHMTQQFQPAIDAYSKAIQLRPTDPDPYWRLGAVLADTDRHDDAEQYFKRAIALKPDCATAYRHLASSTMQMGEVNEAIPLFRKAAMLAPDDLDTQIHLAFAMQMSDLVSPTELLQQHRQLAEQFADPLAGKIPKHGNDRSPDRIIRVAYVSPDLHNHPVATFLLPILQNHDRAKFHVTCYCNSWIGDEMTAQLRAAVQGWRVTPHLTDEQLAAQIVEDRIDVLVDLAQYSGGKRILLFARKPAPVQVTYLGYPGTTGIKTFDARLSDPYIDPPGQTEQFYTEPTVRLPETYWCLQPIVEAPAVQAAPAIAAGYVTFGCLNKLSKSSPSALQAWCAILQRVENSRLLLTAPAGGYRQKILDLFQNQGIDPQRIELISRQSFADYLVLYHRIDIALDPFPYNGGTTTCQALWMGVPVITFAGTAGVQRSGASLLSNAGLPEMIATKSEQYVQLAVDLAADLPRLSALRERMRERMTASPLMAMPRFVGNLEAIYRKLWNAWCERPASTTV